MSWIAELAPLVGVSVSAITLIGGFGALWFRVGLLVAKLTEVERAVTVLRQDVDRQDARCTDLQARPSPEIARLERALENSTRVILERLTQFGDRIAYLEGKLNGKDQH